MTSLILFKDTHKLQRIYDLENLIVNSTRSIRLGDLQDLQSINISQVVESCIQFIAVTCNKFKNSSRTKALQPSQIMQKKIRGSSHTLLSWEVDVAKELFLCSETETSETNLSGRRLIVFPNSLITESFIISDILYQLLSLPLHNN